MSPSLVCGQQSRAGPALSGCSDSGRAGGRATHPHGRVTLQSLGCRSQSTEHSTGLLVSLNARLSRQHNHTRKELFTAGQITGSRADNEAREAVGREKCSHLGLGNRKPGRLEGHSEREVRIPEMRGLPGPLGGGCEASLGL